MHMGGRDIVLVDRDDQLPALVATLEGAPRLVVDTEFHTERRYHPELVLIQLAREADGPIFVVDASAVAIAPLRPLLDGAVWIAHGASQDVAVLHRSLGCRPSMLLDTQVFAGMGGHPFPARLGDLCRDVLDMALDKSSGLSDWTRRPLSQSQLHYAAADVAVLPQLLQALQQALDPQRQDWAVQAGTETIESALKPADPDRHWRRLRIAHRFDPTTRAVLHRVAAWREALAESRNRPPHYILSGPLLLDLARRQPQTIAELSSNRRFPDRLARQCGETLLELVAASRAEPGTVAPVPDPRQQRTATLLQLWAAARARSAGLAATLVMDEALAQATVRGTPLDGWRRELLGDDPDRLLRGEIAVRIVDDDVEPLEQPTTTR